MEFQKVRLHALKRAELQKLCKEFGIKANMKTTKLIEALVCYYGAKENTANVAHETEMSADHDCCESNEDKLPSTQVMKEPENKTSNLEIKTSCKEKEKTSNIKVVSAMASKIPRLTKSLKKADCSASSTPINTITCITPKTAKDWSKIHQKQFAKMDSLNVYMEKKRIRAEQLCSGKKVQSTTTPKLGQVAERKTRRLAFQFSKKSNKENTTALPDQQKQKTPIGVTSTTKSNLKRKRTSTELESEKTTSEVKKIKSNYATPKFQPAVGKEKRLIFNFSKTKENAVTPGMLRRRATLGASKGTNGSGQKPATPFRFSAVPNTKTFLSPTPRKTFDLKASLSKALGYKPHYGKLATAPCAKHNSKTTSVKKTSHEKDVKAFKVTSRKERRDQTLKNKAKRRSDCVGKRRRMVAEEIQ